MSVIEVTYKPYKEKKVKSSIKNKKSAKEESSTNDNSSVSSTPNNNNVGKNTGFRYPAYLSEEEVKEGLENGSLIEVWIFLENFFQKIVQNIILMKMNKILTVERAHRAELNDTIFYEGSK